MRLRSSQPLRLSPSLQQPHLSVARRTSASDIQPCIRVPGPWVVVPAHGTAQYLLTCPKGGSVVGGLDAQVTSRDVHVDVRRAARRSGLARADDDALRALPRGVDVVEGSGVPAAPRLHPGPGRRRALDGLCTGLPARASARVPLTDRRHRPRGREVRTRVVSRQRAPGRRLARGRVPDESRRRTSPGRASSARRHIVVGKKVVVTASSTDALSIDAHAIVQAVRSARLHET